MDHSNQAEFEPNVLWSKMSWISSPFFASGGGLNSASKPKLARPGVLLVRDICYDSRPSLVLRYYYCTQKYLPGRIEEGDFVKKLIDMLRIDLDKIFTPCCMKTSDRLPFWC